jgi:hypothetical protein
MLHSESRLSSLCIPALPHLHLFAPSRRSLLADRKCASRSATQPRWLPHRINLSRAGPCLRNDGLRSLQGHSQLTQDCCLIWRIYHTGSQIIYEVFFHDKTAAFSRVRRDGLPYRIEVQLSMCQDTRVGDGCNIASNVQEKSD